jgi:hypothetical protein
VSVPYSLTGVRTMPHRFLSIFGYPKIVIRPAALLAGMTGGGEPLTPIRSSLGDPLQVHAETRVMSTPDSHSQALSRIDRVVTHPSSLVQAPRS